jgi:prevent-host-death family protein
MSVRKLGVSEVRRRLPELVEAVARDGGRVDVTRRGESRVSIVRTADLDGAAKSSRAVPAGLRVEFNFPSDRLVEVIRGLRAQWSGPRVAPRRARKPARN